jgi:serine/threonine-protein kinase
MAKLCPTCGNSYDDRNVFCPTDGSTLRTAVDAADLIGSVIADRYLVTAQLGEGGMGRVYLAQHVRIPQQAAIKVLHPALVHDPDALARFNHEASNACRISDTHVARVYDFGETGTGLVYLAMEYVPGETLNELLKKVAPFPPPRAGALTRQIAAGLDAAHKLGIVHRDLKPDNILVMHDADGEELVKVVDFGIAKAIDTNTQNVTKTGFVLGTAQYMSPEQVSGRIVDRRSDVYALGLVAFMMLTGKLPFPAETAEEAMVKRLTEPPRTLAEMHGDVQWPTEVQQVFDGALARDLDQRYPTAGAFGKALADAIGAWHHAGAAATVARPAAPAAPKKAAPPPAARVDPAAPHAPTTTAPPARPTWRLALLGSAVAVASIAGLILAVGGDGPDSTGVETLTAASSQTQDSTGRPSTQSVESGALAPIPGDAPAPPPAIAPDSATATRGGSVPAAGVGGGGRTALRPAPTGDEAGAAAAASAELDRVLGRLHPDTIDQATARIAVASLRALLPRLGTSHDSLRAELGRANAHFFLDEIDDACAVLRSFQVRASAVARGQIRDQMRMFGCE